MNNLLLEKEKEEAIRRMQLIGLPFEIMEEFKDSGKIYISASAEFSFQPEDSILAYVQEFEKKYAAVVYHAIYSVSYDYQMISLLYVSPYDSEWENDRVMLEHNQTFSYVYNLNIPVFSEYGTITFENQNGILIRKA